MFNIHPVRTPAPHRISGGGRRAIVVDTDPDHSAVLLRHLVGVGYVVVIAQGWFEALSMIGRDGPSVALFQRDGENGDCDRAVALSRMLYPDTQIVLTDDKAPAIDGNPSTEALLQGQVLLRRPVNLSLLDACLTEMAALRATQ